jgi:DNA-directed RNA polymerase specialized sigma24 family protein
MNQRGPSPESMIGTFDRHRLLPFSIAYRMIGGVADAENILQDTYLRREERPEYKEDLV